MADVIIELGDRRARFNNLILLDLSETNNLDGSLISNYISNDRLSVVNILNNTMPYNYDNQPYIAVDKIDKNIANEPRLLKIALPLSFSTIEIFKWRNNYKGPVKIPSNQTEHNRKVICATLEINSVLRTILL